MIELEIKVKISDPEIMINKFKDHGGIYKISLYHEDTYFNMPKGLRDFKETDEALRLRKSVEINKFDNPIEKTVNYYITYNGKKIDITTKTREEIDVKIEDIEKIRDMLKLLGFQEIFTVKKERELFEFEFQTYHIEALIDYIPILEQYFIEVEYLVESAENLNSSREVLFEFLTLFDIKKEESIRKSYLELISDMFKGELKK